MGSVDVVRYCSYDITESLIVLHWVQVIMLKASLYFVAHLMTSINVIKKPLIQYSKQNKPYVDLIHERDR